MTDKYRARLARYRRSLVTVKDITERLNLSVVAGERGLNCQVKNVYISDLLSDVMTGAKADMLWMTIQTHQNVVAVAVLKELSAVLLLGGRQPSDNTCKKAENEGIPLLLSKEHAFELAGKLHALWL